MSLSIGTSFVLWLGPSLQTFSFALLTSGEPTIYSSVFGNGFVDIAQVPKWFIAQLTPAYCVLSIGFFFLTRKIDRPREIFIWALPYFCVGLTLIDISNFIFRKNFYASNSIFECLIANLFGAALIAGLIVCFAKISSSILEFSSSQKSISRGISILSPVFSGALVVGAFLMMLNLFFRPTEARIDVVLEKEISAFYVTPPIKKNETNENFGLLAHGGSASGDVTLATPELPPEISWNRGGRPQKFMLQLAVFNNCSNVSEANKRMTMGNVVTFPDVDRFKIRPDSGLNIIKTDNQETYDAKLIPDTEGTRFWIESNEGKNKTYKLSVLSVGKGAVNLINSNGGLKFILEIPLFKRDKSHNISTHTRALMANINGKSYSFDVRPRENSRHNNPMICETPVLRRDTKNSTMDMEAKPYDASVLIKLEPVGSPNVFYTDDRAELAISHINGVITFDHISADQISRASQSGRIQSAMFSTGIKSLRVYDAKVELAPLEELTILHGLLTASFDQDGRFHAFGIADTAFRGQSRLNRTRWERLDNSVKLLLVSLIGTLALGPLFTFLVFILKKDDPMSWA